MTYCPRYLRTFVALLNVYLSVYEPFKFGTRKNLTSTRREKKVTANDEMSNFSLATITQANSVAKISPQMCSTQPLKLCCSWKTASFWQFIYHGYEPKIQHPKSSFVITEIILCSLIARRKLHFPHKFNYATMISLPSLDDFKSKSIISIYFSSVRFF